jgi:integrase
MNGWIVTRTARDGTKRYDARWRIAPGRIKGKTFTKRKSADAYLTTMVQRVQDGTYVEVQPTVMSDVFDRWLEHEVHVRVKEGSLKASTASSYKSMMLEHLKPAFGSHRSDRFTLGVVEEWRKGVAARIAAGTLSAKSYMNLRNLLSSVIRWSRHPDRRYLAHDPLAGLPKVRLPRGKKRPHFEPDQVARLLALAKDQPPDDTILMMTALSGLRRGELFALQWPDVEAGVADGGVFHIRRRIYQGEIDNPKTPHSDRVVDIPRRLLDELAVYKVMYPPIGEGFIFRTADGSPLDGDNWHKRHLVPLLERAGLRLPKSGLHALRHSYVSLLADQGEDVHYISRQVGHASTQLTEDIYRHTFTTARMTAMRRLNAALPQRSAT